MLESRPKLKMTAGDKKILTSQVIDETGPGSILADFDAFLNFFGVEGMPVSVKRAFIPLKFLIQLNERMTRPIDVGLKRPLQKSFPNINGLYLLLMSTEMALLKSKGKKPAMAIDKALLDQWRELNAAERYFTLLEAWLIKGRIDIIDERSFNAKILYRDWCEFFKETPPKGLKVKGDKEKMLSLSYLPGLYAVALMDMFGLASVRQRAPEKGKGWSIDSIHPTPFGRSLLKLLAPFFFGGEYFTMYLNEDFPDFGMTQGIVAPFFPEWENNLPAAVTSFQGGLYTFKVSLGKAWRRIAIQGSTVFEDLAAAILNAFSFDRDHLYQFTYRNRLGYDENIGHPYSNDEPLITTDVRIGDVGITPGSRLTFLFDFGDNWMFELMPESIDPDGDDLEKPRVIESRGEPPEQYPTWDDDDEW